MCVFLDGHPDEKRGQHRKDKRFKNATNNSKKKSSNVRITETLTNQQPSIGFAIHKR